MMGVQFFGPTMCMYVRIYISSDKVIGQRRSCDGEY